MCPYQSVGVGGESLYDGCPALTVHGCSARLGGCRSALHATLYGLVYYGPVYHGVPRVVQRLGMIRAQAFGAPNGDTRRDAVRRYTVPAPVHQRSVRQVCTVQAARTHGSVRFGTVC